MFAPSPPGRLRWNVEELSSGRVLLALQAAGGIHLGVDNLGVVRHVVRLLDGNGGSRPAELVKDGDLILLVGWMLRLGGLDTVPIAEVKGHADEGMVRDGGVRDLDRLGNNAADEAADFGRRVDFSRVCGRWYPVVLTLHGFFNCSCSPDPLVWSAGALPKRRRLVHAVRDRAFCLGQQAFGRVNGSLLPLHLSLLRMLGLGHILLEFGLSLLFSWERYTGLWQVLT